MNATAMLHRYCILWLLLAIWPPEATASFVVSTTSRKTSWRHCGVGGHSSHRRGVRSWARISDDDDARGKEPSFPRTSSRIDSNSGTKDKDGLGGFEPDKKIPVKRDVVVGDPQLRVVKEKEMSVTSILKELAAIQQQGPQKYCILGTRHCSFLHQQIIELLAFALVLSGNHVYTSGSVGTHAAAVRGALRAERPDLLTVVLPQSMHKQPVESQDLLKDVTDLVTMPQNDEMSLDVASRICNSYLLSQTDQLVSFAFHDSTTVLEANNEAKKLDMLVTTLYLD